MSLFKKKLMVSYGALDILQKTNFKLKDDIKITDIPVARYTFDQKPFQYNQDLTDTMSCSCYGTGACLSSLVGNYFFTSDFDKIWQQEVDKGNASHIWGGYVVKMMDAWAKYWNSNHEEKVIYFEVKMNNVENVKMLLDRGYRIATGYNNHIGFNADWQNDCVIDKNYDDSRDDEDWGEKTQGGHCISIAKTEEHKVKDCEYVIIDNYVDKKGREKNNIYGLRLDLLQELVNRGIVMNHGYVFMFDDDSKVIDRALQERAIAKHFIFRAESNGDVLYVNSKGQAFSYGTKRCKEEMIRDNMTLPIKDEHLKNFEIIK